MDEERERERERERARARQPINILEPNLSLSPSLVVLIFPIIVGLSHRFQVRFSVSFFL
jgi:hypothetical protein